jgi:predicted nucleic-acid-binding Zn-ribbon protein
MIVEPGKWYFVVSCANCGRATAFSEAPSPEQEAVVAMSEFQWKCPHCNDERTYQPEQVERSQGRYKQ